VKVPSSVLRQLASSVRHLDVEDDGNENYHGHLLKSSTKIASPRFDSLEEDNIPPAFILPKACRKLKYDCNYF